MAQTSFDEAYSQWRTALGSVTCGAAELSEWQKRRFHFAFHTGALLTAGTLEGGPPVVGPVVYGVHIPGVGLSYIGQTQKAERRLRDLPVGESHHLANTIPPELWERVVVVCWPSLLDQLEDQERATIDNMGRVVCGLALEHLLQVDTEPPLNLRRRTNNGLWKQRRLTASKSRGALQSAAIPRLHALVRDEWNKLSSVPAPCDGSARVTTEFGRTVFPSVLRHDVE